VSLPVVGGDIQRMLDAFRRSPKAVSAAEFALLQSVRGRKGRQRDMVLFAQAQKNLSGLILSIKGKGRFDEFI